jgi:hypothetical protein
MLIEKVARVCQFEGSRVPYKQSYAQLFFELLDLSAQGRLCNEKFFRSSCEVLFFCNSNKVA